LNTYVKNILLMLVGFGLGIGVTLGLTKVTTTKNIVVQKQDINVTVESKKEVVKPQVKQNSQIYNVWLNARNMQLSKKDACRYNVSVDDISQGMGEKGLLTLYCAVSSLISIKDIQELSGQKVFLAGPHNEEKINIASSDFAHYNPAFLKWAKGVIIPISENETFKKHMQDIYNDYFRYVARTYYATNQYLYLHEDDAQEMLNAYSNSIKNTDSPYYDFGGKYLWSGSNPFMKELYKYSKGRDGFTTLYSIEAVAFWLRRDMDGSRDEFTDIINHLVKTFDKKYYDNHSLDNGFATHDEIEDDPMPTQPKKRDLSEVQEGKNTTEKMMMLMWNNLTKTTQSTSSECSDVFNYYPNGGLRSFYCVFSTTWSIPNIEELAGINIFLNDVHGKNNLNFSSSSFGHYNPEFLRWFRKEFLPANVNENFKIKTQSLYNKYLQEKARTYFVVNNALKQKPEKAEALVQEYKNLIRTSLNPYLHLSTFDAETDDSEYNWNIVTPASAFWLRREIDGTRDEFSKILNDLLLTYDKKFYEENR